MRFLSCCFILSLSLAAVTKFLYSRSDITTFLVGFFSVFIISFPKPHMDFSPVGTSTFFMCRFAGNSKSDLSLLLYAVHSSFLSVNFFFRNAFFFLQVCFLFVLFVLYLYLR